MIIRNILNDRHAALGAAGFFIMLAVSLVIGAFVYAVMSPFFDALNQQAISLYSGTTAKYYPENVQENTIFIFQFIEYALVVFFLLISGFYLKGYIQPWTRGR